MVKKVIAIDTSKLVNKKDYKATIKDIEDKLLDISTLAATTAVTAVKNKVPNVSDLVKETDYDNKIKETQSKYFTTFDYNSRIWLTNNYFSTTSIINYYN